MEFFPEIKEFLITKDDRSYRYRQFCDALTKETVQNFEEITTFSMDLRIALDRNFPGFFPELLTENRDDQCLKFMLRLADGSRIETVLIQNKKTGTNVVCCSIQVGCPLGCRFCRTGMKGFKRNLSHWEIAAQTFFAAGYLKQFNEKVTGVVLMGMGEPFLNTENVIEALRLINDVNGFALGSRSISVSTAGIIPGIRRFASLSNQYNLAISLHTPFEDQRQQLMPISKKYPLSTVIKAAKDYIKKTNRKVMLEYVLLEGVNTSEKHIRALAVIAKSDLFHINLVNYNETGGGFSRVRRKKAEEILEHLKAEGAGVTLRRSAGEGINAACGQLAGG